VLFRSQDIKEIESILSKLKNFVPSDVCLMPEGVDVNTLNSRTGWIAEQAVMRGWRFCPRLHIMMFGKNRYV
jgi:7-carboxy-7-deazaguanine synthase